jgi:hypothetical protein
MPQSDDSLGGGQGSGQPVRKDIGTQGRGDGQGSEGTSSGGHTGSKHGSPQPASVVIRATVEHVGLVGDTELTVNVKWPASIFCVQPYGKPAAPSGQASDSQNVPANGPDAGNVGNFDRLYGEATDPAPYVGLHPEPQQSAASAPNVPWGPPESTHSTASASPETSGPSQHSSPTATDIPKTSGPSEPQGSTKN